MNYLVNKIRPETEWSSYEQVEILFFFVFN